MNVEEYQKIARVFYRNRVFDVFRDQRHNKTFLEVQEKNGEEEYHFPTLSDYLYLNHLYNQKRTTVLESKKLHFKVQIIVAGTLISLGIIGSVGAEKIHTHLVRQKYENWEAHLEEINEVTDEYTQKEKEIEIYDNDVLSKFGFQDVSFDDVFETLENNSNLDSTSKEDIREFILLLQTKAPDIDLRIFNENLKLLTVQKEDNSKFRQNIFARFDSKNHTIELREDYTSDGLRKINFYHELVHTLNVLDCSRVIRDSEYGIEETYHIKKDYRLENNYGISALEAYTAIFTDYLMDEDYIHYFDRESRNYQGYWNISPIYYQVLKATNYTFEDFINKNVSSLEEKLKEIDLENIIDVIDINMNKPDQLIVGNNEILMDLNVTLLKHRILQIWDPIESPETIYDAANKIDLCLGFQGDICNDMLLENNEELLRKRESVVPTIRFYDYEQLFCCKNQEDCKNLCVYSDEFGTWRLGDLKFKFGEYKLYDFLTNMDVTNYVNPEKVVAWEYVFSDGKFIEDNKVELEDLNSKEFTDYVSAIQTKQM